MAITKLTTNGIYGDKYGDIAANNSNWYEAIATTLVGSGGQASVEFTNIPSDYTHLQIRGVQRGATTGTGSDSSLITFNNDTGSNYATHRLFGNGSSVTSDAYTSRADMILSALPRNGNTSSWNGLIIDILDYKDTSKFKTIRILSGNDLNGSGDVWLLSGLWRNTNAVTSIKISAGGSTPSFVQHTRFSLYGLRG